MNSARTTFRVLTLAVAGFCLLASTEAGQWRWAVKTGSGGLTAAGTYGPPTPPVAPTPKPPAYLPPAPTLPRPATPTYNARSGAVFVWSSSMYWGFISGFGRGW